MNADVSELIQSLGNELADFQPSSAPAVESSAPLAVNAPEDRDEGSQTRRKLEMICRAESAKHAELMSARVFLQVAWDQLQQVRDRAAVLLGAMDAAAAEEEGGAKAAAAGGNVVSKNGSIKDATTTHLDLPHMDEDCDELVAFRDKLDVRALLMKELLQAEMQLEDSCKSVSRLSGSILALHGETDADGGNAQSSEIAAALRSRLEEARGMMDACELDFTRSKVLCAEFDTEIQLAAIHIAAKARVGGFAVPACVVPYLGADADSANTGNAEPPTETAAAHTDREPICAVSNDITSAPEGDAFDSSEEPNFSVQDVIDGHADVRRIKGESAAHFRARLERRLRIVEPMVLQLKRQVDKHVETVRDLRLEFKDLEVQRLRLELSLASSKELAQAAEVAEDAAGQGKKSVTFDDHGNLSDDGRDIRDSPRYRRVAEAESDDVPRMTMLNAIMETNKNSPASNIDAVNSRSRAINRRRARNSEAEDSVSDLPWSAAATPQRSLSAPSVGLSARRARLTASGMKRRELADASFAHIKEMIDTSAQSIGNLDSAQAMLKVIAAPSPGGMKLQRIREMAASQPPPSAVATAFDSPLSPVKAPDTKKSYVLAENLESPLDNADDSTIQAEKRDSDSTGIPRSVNDGSVAEQGGELNPVSPAAPTDSLSPSADIIISPVGSPSPRPVTMSKNELNEQVRRITKEMASSPFVMRSKNIGGRSPSPHGKASRSGSADESESRINALVTPSANRSPSPALIRTVSRSSPDRTRAVFQQQSQARQKSLVASMSSDGVFSQKMINQIRDHIRNEQRKIEECYIKLDALLISREKLKKQLRELKGKKSVDGPQGSDVRSKVQLKLMIVMARNLAEPSRSHRPLDPFVEVWAEAVDAATPASPQHHGGKPSPPRVFVEDDETGEPMEMLRFVTHVKRAQLAPRWDEVFDIALPCQNKAQDIIGSDGKVEPATTMSIMDRSLRIFVRDSIRNTNDMVDGFQNIIGECFLDLTSLLDQKPHTMWLPISDAGIPKKPNSRHRKVPHDCALKVQARLLYSKELFLHKKLVDIISEMEELMGFVEICSNGLIDLVHTWDQMQEKRARLEELKSREIANMSRVSNVSLPRSISRERRMSANHGSQGISAGNNARASAPIKSIARQQHLLVPAPTVPPVVELEPARVVQTYTIPPTPTVQLKTVTDTAVAPAASVGPGASLAARRAAMIAKIKAGEDLLSADESSALSESTQRSSVHVASELYTMQAATDLARMPIATDVGVPHQKASPLASLSVPLGVHPVNMSIFRAPRSGKSAPVSSRATAQVAPSAPLRDAPGRRSRSKSEGRRTSQALWR